MTFLAFTIPTIFWALLVLAVLALLILMIPSKTRHQTPSPLDMKPRQSIYDGPLGIEFRGPESTGYSNVTRDFRDEWIGLIERARAAKVEVLRRDSCGGHA